MIEYLSAASFGGLSVIVFIYGMAWIRQRVQRMNDILEFIGNILKWLHYYNDLQENKATLRTNTNTLNAKEKDIRDRANIEEQQTGGIVKEEVKNWLTNASSIQQEAGEILNKLSSAENGVWLLNLMWLIWLGSRVEIKITKIGELSNAGTQISDMDSLISSVRQNPQLPPQQLVGEAAQANLRDIVNWATSDDASLERIKGIHGGEGYGKTVLMTEIHNRLIKSSFSNVYWISVNSDSSLQIGIAKEVLGVDLREDQEMIRRARLYNALCSKDRFVLIIDGVCQHLDLRNIGIPVDKGKVIISSRYKNVIQKTGCSAIISLEALSDAEAETLFDIENGRASFNPEINMIKRKIISKCGNVPGRIKTVARQLIGEDDLAMWRVVESEIS
ncbi:Disease resistance protein SUMM2-like protein [Drosera capensis]